MEDNSAIYDDTPDIGAEVSADSINAWMKLAFVISLIVYAGMIAYSATHNWQLLTSGVNPDWVFVAAIGVISMELTAIALPLALHFWTHDSMQRIFAFGFYALDMVIIIANSLVNYAFNTGTTAELPHWLETYRVMMLPAAPIVTGIGWSIIWMLDPAQRERATREALKAATRRTLQRQIYETASRERLGKQVRASAQLIADQIVADTLGVSTAQVIHNRTGSRKPAALKAPEPEPVMISYNAETEAADTPRPKGN